MQDHKQRVAAHQRAGTTHLVSASLREVVHHPGGRLTFRRRGHERRGVLLADQVADAGDRRRGEVDGCRPPVLWLPLLWLPLL